MLLVALAAVGILAGSAARLPLPAFLAAAGAIAAWLLLFGAREHLPRSHRH
ncbi:hypothetical protein [Kitasatospora sp. NPDC088346]|uniref:hypothetical protein n=1 Tax=Kitasatospora sp. NPDC088346 TaxID=3364073 RepID=UPI00380DE993